MYVILIGLLLVSKEHLENTHILFITYPNPKGAACCAPAGL